MDTPTNTSFEPISKVSSLAKSETNKILKSFGYLFFMSFILSSLSFIFTNKSYSINSYFMIHICIFILGIIHLIVFFKYSHKIRKATLFEGFLYTTIIMLVAITIINYSHYLNKSIKVNLDFNFAYTIFLLPFIFMVCFDLYWNIPVKKYAFWIYPLGKEVPVVEVINSIKIKFYLSKKQEDDHFNEFELNVPTYVKLGDFIHYFFYRYNHDKNPDSPIMTSKDNIGSIPYQWNFYKPRLKYFRSYLDHNKTIEELKIHNNDTIYLVRLNEEELIKNESDLNIN
jgi:hypothetical protein